MQVYVCTKYSQVNKSYTDQLYDTIIDLLYDENYMTKLYKSIH